MAVSDELKESGIIAGYDEGTLKTAFSV